MTYEFTTIDGCRVEVTVAAAFRRMAAAFKRDTGYDLRVRDGSRTRSEQQSEWDQYVARGYRPPRVARPGESNHEIDGPNGPRSLDIYDTGQDAGVTVFGTARDGWMQRNAPTYGFENEGNNFAEPWHKTYRGDIGTSWNRTARPTADIQRAVGAAPDGVYGPETDAKIRAFQGKFGLDADGIWGPASDAVAFLTVDGEWGDATTRRVQAAFDVPVDGKMGPVTWRAIQTHLRIPADGTPGPQTYAALQRALGVTADGQLGPCTITALQRWLVAGGILVPVPEEPTGDIGKNYTSRPVKEIQQRLLDLGYDLAPGADGKYGVATTAAVSAFQRDSSLEADGDWGAASDGIAFPPAGSLHGVDYSFARPDIATLVQRGIRHVGRYLWQPAYADGRTNKGIDRAEFDALTSAGIAVWFIYEEDGRELLGGHAAGVRAAQEAEKYLAALDLAGYPVYFNVDFDADAAQQPAILAALDGAGSVIGKDRVGLYAGHGPIAAAFDAGKIRWGFQTHAWSDGHWDPRTHLQQWATNQWGDTVDFTRAMTTEYGQHPVTTPKPEPDDTVPVERSWLQGILDKLRGILGVAS